MSGSLVVVGRNVPGCSRHHVTLLSSIVPGRGCRAALPQSTTEALLLYKVDVKLGLHPAKRPLSVRLQSLEASGGARFAPSSGTWPMRWQTGGELRQNETVTRSVQTPNEVLCFVNVRCRRLLFSVTTAHSLTLHLMLSCQQVEVAEQQFLRNFLETQFFCTASSFLRLAANSHFLLIITNYGSPKADFDRRRRTAESYTQRCESVNGCQCLFSLATWRKCLTASYNRPESIFATLRITMLYRDVDTTHRTWRRRQTLFQLALKSDVNVAAAVAAAAAATSSTIHR